MGETLAHTLIPDMETERELMLQLVLMKGHAPFVEVLIVKIFHQPSCASTKQLLPPIMET